MLAFSLDILPACGGGGRGGREDVGEEVVGGREKAHVVAAVVHLLNVLGEEAAGVGVGSALLQLGESGLEQVDLSVDLLLLALVEALALLAGLGRQALADGGEEVGHAGEVSAGLPVLPADLAEGEGGGVVEGEEEEAAAVLFQEAAIGVEGPALPFLADGLGGAGRFRPC